MSFADLIKQAKAEVEQHTGGNNDTARTVYPKTKHKGIYFNSTTTTEVFFQLLPARNMDTEPFAVKFRNIFLEAKTSKGKELRQNFMLDAEPNPGSILEQAIAEWTDKLMLPSKYGQVKPRIFFKVNVIKVVTQQVQNPKTGQTETQYLQERDQEGNYVVRTLDLPVSAYNGIIEKLGNPMLNPQGPNGSPMSFMDVSKPAMVHVAKPLPNTQAYRVEVYPLATLPALEPGWENQLEDLQAQVVPTERLENGLEWVKAFIDIKNGVNPNANKPADSNSGQAPAAAPATNPYAQTHTTAPTAPPVAPPAANQYTAPPTAPVAPPTASYTPPTAPPVTAPPIQQPAAPTLPPTAPPSAGTDLNYDSVPDFAAPPAPPTAPTAPATDNGQGLPDIDAALNNLLSNN